MQFSFIFPRAIGYAAWLTIWSLTLYYSRITGNTTLITILGFAVLFLMYFYLKWCISAIDADKTTNPRDVTNSGLFIAAIGCALSSTAMWFINQKMGFNSNSLFECSRAIAFHAVIGGVMSHYIGRSLKVKERDA
jgi:hypothetical protein